MTGKALEAADMLSSDKHTFSASEAVPLSYERVRFCNGTTAVVPGQSRVTVLQGGRAVTAQVRSLSTWVKRNGSWQMALVHSEVMPAKS